MACLNRPSFATYTVTEKVTIDTTDNEDHTFCGIVFPIQAKRVLPVKHIIINSISIRGRLGPLTVWVTNEDDSGIVELLQGSSEPSSSSRYNLRTRNQLTRQSKLFMNPKYFTQVYEKVHTPKSFRDYEELDLSQNPIILKPGQIRAIYIHSTREDDQAIVYDNQQKLKTYDDAFLSVLPGRSHVSPEAFGNRPIWGWGNAWRDNREFVGKISYGVIYQLWNPNTHLHFGNNFQKTVETVLACQRRWESPFSMLSDDCIYYILNMCRWDWLNDDYKEMRRSKRNLLWLEASQDKQELEDSDKTDSNEEQKGNDMDISLVLHDNSEEMDDDVIIRDSGKDESDDGEEDDHDEDDEDEDEDEDDEDYEDSEDEDQEDDDDGYEDHRGSSAFQFTHYDEIYSTDEEHEAEAAAVRDQRRRALWFRHHIFQAAVEVLPRHIQEGGSDDE